LEQPLCRLFHDVTEVCILVVDQAHRGDESAMRDASTRCPRGSDSKMFFSVRHDLAVAGVIGGFHANDAIADFRVLFAQVFGKLRLGAGGADDQDFTGVADGIHHLRKNSLSNPA
jgi:hypothetical protein